jgi:hypothetical protein
VKKTLQNKNESLGSDSIRTEKALTVDRRKTSATAERKIHFV